MPESHIAQQMLATARPDDLVVTAVVSPDGGSAISVLNPHAARLVDLASSLLDQAADMLRTYHRSTDEEDLLEQIEDAIGILPDRFAEAEG